MLEYCRSSLPGAERGDSSAALPGWMLLDRSMAQQGQQLFQETLRPRAMKATAACTGSLLQAEASPETGGQQPTASGTRHVGMVNWLIAARALLQVVSDSIEGLIQDSSPAGGEAAAPGTAASAIKNALAPVLALDEADMEASQAACSKATGQIGSLAIDLLPSIASKSKAISLPGQEIIEFMKRG